MRQRLRTWCSILATLCSSHGRSSKVLRCFEQLPADSLITQLISHAPCPADYKAEINTAGSTGLIIQIALPCLVFAPAPVNLSMTGGTNCIMAPQLDYITRYHPLVSLCCPVAVDASHVLVIGSECLHPWPPSLASRPPSTLHDAASSPRCEPPLPHPPCSAATPC